MARPARHRERAVTGLSLVTDPAAEAAVARLGAQVGADLLPVLIAAGATPAETATVAAALTPVETSGLLAALDTTRETP